MAERVNLANPELEPTDEQLEQLSKEAFAGVREAHERALARVHADIERERRRVLEWLERTPA